MFKIKNHLLEGVKFIESPNFSLRPVEKDITVIVIHNISLPPGEFGGDYVQDFFINNLNSTEHPYFGDIKELKVSSHLFIDRKGKLTQFVPFNRAAWHAGISSFKGKENCNDFSIGIELEGTDTIAYTNKQYSTLGLVSKTLLENYPHILLENIVGHSEIAPVRKTDPGKSFNWKAFKASLE